MNYQKQYADKINWKNSPDTSTPLNATNLNKMDNALWYMDNALYTISKAIGGGSSARGGIISNVGNNMFVTHIHQRTGESLAENELLILRSDVSGTGTGIDVYTDSSSAVGFELLDLDGESTSITVTTDSVVVLMITDADTDYTAQVLAVIDTAASGSMSYAGLGIGKKTGVSSNVIDTDIDLYRAPMAGDRLLVYFDETVQNPTGLKTYNNGVAVTSNLENATPLYINAGLNILEFKNDGLLYNNVWVRKQNIPIVNTLAGMSDTLINSPSDDQLLVFDNGKWKNQKYIEANVGFSDTELKKIKVGDIVYDTDGLRDYFVSNIANNNITISVLNSNQFVMENIAINTGNHSGSSNGWNLVLNDGMNPISVALKNADGSVFADDIHENELLFVYVDTAGNVARVLEIHSHDLEILKDAIITEKTVSGNPVTVTDALPYNAVEVVADITPDQDLHGQSAPYVGGAGKNKLPLTVANLKAKNEDGTWTGNSYAFNGITADVLTDAAGNVTGIKLNGTATTAFTLYLAVGFSSTDYPNQMKVNGAYGVGNNNAFIRVQELYTWTVLADDTGASADGVAFTPTSTQAQAIIRVYQGTTVTNAVFKPMFRLATESNSDFAPYTNICPISGRTQVVETRTGKNIWNYGVASDNQFSSAHQIKGLRTFTVSAKTTGVGQINVCGYNSQGTKIYSDAALVTSGNTYGTKTITVSEDLWLCIYKITSSTVPSDVQVENGSVATDYEAYKGQTKTILLSQTMYGDSVAIVKDGSGWKKVETIGHGFVVIGDISNITMYTVGANNDKLFRCSLSDILPEPNKYKKPDMWCSGYPTTANADRGDMTISQAENVASFDIIDNNFNDATTFKTTRADIQVCYPLATPQIIETSITVDDVIQMLSGYNTLYADSGALTLTYKADRIKALEDALAQLGA